MFIVDTSEFHLRILRIRISLPRLAFNSQTCKAHLPGHGDDDDGEVSVSDEQQEHYVTAVEIPRDFEELRQNCEKAEFVLKCVFGESNIADGDKYEDDNDA